MLNYPKIDLHGYDRDYARIMINEFILDNVKIGSKKIIIIHGKGTGILRKEVLDILKKHKKVLKYELNMFNDGETIVTLNTKID